MYKATKPERKELIDSLDYTAEIIDSLDAESEKVRRGVPIDPFIGMAVCAYQATLQKIRKSQKRWWQFWK